MSKRIRVPLEQFIHVYMEVFREGGGYQEAAGRLGMKLTTLYQRCHSLRRQGVVLPRLQPAVFRGGTAARANRLLAEIQGVAVGTKDGARNGQDGRRAKALTDEQGLDRTSRENCEDFLDAIFCN